MRSRQTTRGLVVSEIKQNVFIALAAYFFSGLITDQVVDSSKSVKN
jgi:hypothetical protein